MLDGVKTGHGGREERKRRFQPLDPCLSKEETHHLPFSELLAMLRKMSGDKSSARSYWTVDSSEQKINSRR